MNRCLRALTLALALLCPACTGDSSPAQPTIVVATPTGTRSARSVPTAAATPDTTPTPCAPCQPRGAGEPDLVVTRPLADQRGAWTHYVNVNDYHVVLAAGEDLWAGTNQGLLRWDEQGQWQRFATEDGLPSNRVTALARAADETLWVGTDQGLAHRHLDGTWTANATPAGVRSLVVDAQGRAWAALDEGQGLVRLGQGQLDRIAREAGFPDDDVYVVTAGAQDRIWCGTAAGISVFDGTTWRAFSLAELGLEGDDPVAAIALGSQGHAWARAGEQVAHHDGSTWYAYPSIHEAVAATFEAVRGTVNANGLWHVDAGGNAWIQGPKRVEIYDGEHWTPQPFTAHDAQAIDSDARGQLWLGTSGAGLLRVSLNDERILHVLSAPPTNQIVAVATAGDRTVWCGTAQGNVGVLDGDTWAAYDRQNSPLDAPAIDRITTDLGGTWVEAQGRIWRFRDGEWTAYESGWQAVEAEYVILVASASTRGLRWLPDGQGNVWAWDGAELGRYDGMAWQRYSVPSAIQEGSVSLTRAARDSRGRLWCGTYGHGLGVFDPQTARWTFHTTQNSILESPHVVDVLVDVTDNVWVSTRSGPGGLYRVAPDGNWQRWGKGDGLPSSDLGDLVADGRGRIWVGGARGLASVESGVVTAITAEDGLLSNRVTALALDGAGRLWIGTWDGLCRYDLNAR